MLVIISGSSGVGKNTIINELIKRMPEVELMPTLTTREMRNNEKQGAPYFFVSETGFKKLIADDELYEYEKVHNSYYGTSKKILNEKIKDKKVLIKDIDVKGTMQLIYKLEKDIVVVPIFLTVSREELIDRLKGRGEKDIELRLQRYDYEQSMAKNYEYVIQNVEMEKTIQILEKIILTHKKN